MPTQFSRRSLIRGITTATAVATLATGLAACGGESDAATKTTDAAGTVTVGRLSNGAAKETTLKVSEVKSISAELPEALKKSGKLVIGSGTLPSGSPPLGFVGSDQKTLTGSEVDLGRLVAAVLGLEPEVRRSTWENLFIGIDSGKVDVGFSNITDTEERKKKYEFASYRKDDLAFEVKKDNTWNFDGNYESLAGKTVSVGNGTNQEKILLEWKA
ncbi:transporter substrate-binding domain-containing protein, partial [Streptomyces aurantiogriseus]